MASAQSLASDALQEFLRQLECRHGIPIETSREGNAGFPINLAIWDSAAELLEKAPSRLQSCVDAEPSFAVEAPDQFLRSLRQHLEEVALVDAATSAGVQEPQGSDTEVEDEPDDAGPGYQIPLYREKFIQPRMPDENYRTCRLAHQGFFAPAVEQACLENAPFAVRYECLRASLASGVALDRFQHLTDKDWASRDVFSQSLLEITQRKLPSMFPADQWNSIFLKDHVSGRICLVHERDTHAATAFQVELLPLKAENDRDGTHLRRFHRKYGAHRFLSVVFQRYSKSTQFATAEIYNTRLIEWLTVPEKSFLGCSWTVLRPKILPRLRRREAQGRTEPGNLLDVTLFATKGPGLLPCSIEECIDWHLNLKHLLNRDRPFAKTYSRLDLGFTTTQATLKFEPAQIRYVDDIRADGTPENVEYQDDNPEWRNLYPSDQDSCEVMSDGCARLSFAAGQQIWRCIKGATKGMPTAFQGRIGPAKGMWSVERSCRNDDSVWIEITKSQVKFQPHGHDVKSHRADPHRLTFEVKDWSKPAPQSKIHRDFIPILEDRGVSRSHLAEGMRQYLASERQDVDAALRDPHRLLKWIETSFSLDKPSAYADPAGKTWPIGNSEAATLLLQAGFDASEPYLRALLRRILKDYFGRIGRALSLTSPYTINLFGIADPYQCLLPGQIHFISSNQIESPDRASSPFLNDMPALVARQPAIRASDIQKVKIMFKMELAHMTDVVVFPSKGIYPLAKKLQGGDYDGDRFWICWDPSFVENFRNAPPPSLTCPPSPDQYGIHKDARTLGEVLADGGVMNLHYESMKLQLQPDLLGIVTNLFTKIAYHSGRLDGSDLDRVADLHDLLIDSAKMGYTFDMAALRDFQKLHLSRKTQNDLRLPEPMFKQVDGESTDFLFRALADSESQLWKLSNILDHLLYEVGGRMARVASHELLQSHQLCQSDRDVKWCFEHLLQALKDEKDETGVQLLSELCVHLRQEVLDVWKPSYGKVKEDKHQSRQVYDAMRTRAYNAYKTFEPSACRQWAIRCAIRGDSFWDYVKASCLYHIAATDSRSPKWDLIYRIAGRTICRIKAQSDQNGRIPTTVAASVMDAMKIRRVKTVHSPEENLGAEDNDRAAMQRVAERSFEQAVNFERERNSDSDEFAFNSGPDGADEDGQAQDSPKIAPASGVRPTSETESITLPIRSSAQEQLSQAETLISDSQIWEE